MKKKGGGFDREKAKKDLEINLLEKIKENYHHEGRKAKEKNELSKKSDADALQVDELLKKLGEIRPNIKNCIHSLQASTKILSPLKAEFSNIMQDFFEILAEFVEKKKSFPIKPNDWVRKVIKDTQTVIQELEREIPHAKSGGFCGGGKSVKGLEKKFIQVRELKFFWFGLLGSDAREGFQEIHHFPQFNENEFRKDLRSFLEDHFPHEQEPQIIKQEVIKRVVESEVKPDHIRLAHELLFGFGRPQDVIAALKIYHQEADKPINKPSDINISACNSLGKIYLDGKFVPQDLKKALYYYERSISRDENDKDAEALYQLGLMEEKGLITDGGKNREENREIAKQYFIGAAEHNHKDAITDLGFMAHEENDLKSALEYYKMAKKLKHPRALNNMGKLYMENQVHEKVKGDNYRKAIKYFHMAAELGNVKALFNLGVCYEKGLGVERDQQKAESLFKDAAQKGDLEGKLFYCSHILRNALGSNKEEDFLEVIRMLHEVLAEDPEKEAAYFYLGYLYEYGFGVGKDFKVALSYYYKAAEFNYPAALNKLGNFFYSGYGVEKIDMAKAIEFYERAAQLNDPDALINLGVLYETGNEYLEKDFEKALECFKKASNELGDARGFLNIGHLYAQGKCGEKNAVRAFEYYQKAANLGDKLALEILASKGKTHLKKSHVEEKEFLKKSMMEKFCDVNHIDSGRDSIIQNTLPSIKKAKERNKSPIISSVITSGLPKEMAEKNTFNPLDFDFNKNDNGNNSHSQRNDNFEYENERLIGEIPHGKKR